MNRVLVCGDTHGVDDIGKIKELQNSENKLDYSDYIIICGDACILWKEETVKSNIAIYESFGTNILFVDGNHENYDLLNSYNVEKWNGGLVHKISNHIIHLMRGQVFDICGKIIFTMGGADSRYKENRVEHKGWWRQERIDLSESPASNYIENLAKYNNSVDYVITHTLPTSVIADYKDYLLNSNIELTPFYLDKTIIKPSNDALEKVLKIIKFKHWYSGHRHTDVTFGKFSILYNNIIELK